MGINFLGCCSTHGFLKDLFIYFVFAFQMNCYERIGHKFVGVWVSKTSRTKERPSKGREKEPERLEGGESKGKRKRENCRDLSGGERHRESDRDRKNKREWEKEGEFLKSTNDISTYDANHTPTYGLIFLHFQMRNNKTNKFWLELSSSELKPLSFGY